MIFNAEGEVGRSGIQTEAGDLRAVRGNVALEGFRGDALETGCAETGDKLEVLADLEGDARAGDELEENRFRSLLDDSTGTVVSTDGGLHVGEAENALYEDIESLVRNQRVADIRGEGEAEGVIETHVGSGSDKRLDGFDIADVVKRAEGCETGKDAYLDTEGVLGVEIITEIGDKLERGSARGRSVRGLLAGARETEGTADIDFRLVKGLRIQAHRNGQQSCEDK